MVPLIVCSFFTSDDYYASRAEELRGDLERLAVPHVLTPMETAAGEDWADICRKKVPFLASVAEAHPDHRVLWIDVDCRLRWMPDFVRSSSADLIGFPRGFGSVLNMGYRNRTRFWEPCFWGIGPSPAARQMLHDAATLEARSTLKATDDYFWEEAWRANADAMTFQVIPSRHIIRDPEAPSPDGFLVFGKSGQVEEFKGKVIQHTAQHAAPLRRTRIYTGVKKAILRAPEPVVRSAVAVGSRTGATRWLRTGEEVGDARRDRLLRQALARGQAGDVAYVREVQLELEQSLLSPREESTLAAAASFAHHAAVGSRDRVPLSWWSRPFPGNFGDWLSPLILSRTLDAGVRYVPPLSRKANPHVLGLGSIARYATERSVLVGTGVSSTEHPIDPRADVVSLRGPLTAAHLAAGGGRAVDRFGDPGVLLSRVLPLQRGPHNGRIALVRHFAHTGVPVTLGEDVDELPVLRSRPEDITAFLTSLIGYRYVVTSAMHVMIACHSYGIPCALVTFDGFEGAVHGSGMKYRDYALGVGLDPIEPIPVRADLSAAPLEDLVHEVTLDEGVLSDVAAAIEEAGRRVLDLVSP